MTLDHIAELALIEVSRWQRECWKEMEMNRYQNIKISNLIHILQEMKEQWGDLPICSEGNDPEDTMVYLTPIDENSVEANTAEKAKQLFIELY